MRCARAGLQMSAAAQSGSSMPPVPPYAPVKPVPVRQSALWNLSQQQPSAHEDASPRLLTILLSRVALGHSTRGSSELRRPPDGYDSTTHPHSLRGADSATNIYCVYNNAQAYPEYIITYKPSRSHSGY